MSRYPLAVALLVLLCACGAARQPPEQRAGDGAARAGPAGTAATLALGACNLCHGGNVNAAPPSSARGATATSDPGVGAHQQHLVGLATRAPLACDECHVVPTTVNAPGHMDPSSRVTFDAAGSSGLARTDGATPRWDPVARTCSGTYCHGATLSGGANQAPVWTRVDGSQRSCGSCHGFPPGGSHPASTACATCHGQTVRPDGTIDLAAGKHLNGEVDLSVAGCTLCHGDPDRQPAAIAAAPPRDASGNTSSPAVGAHQRHLGGGATSRPVACGECHVVPTDASHRRQHAAPAFGTLARTGGAAATWDATQRTCAVYCHGAARPVWDGGPSQAACGSCHGLPPTTRHPDVAGGLPGCSVCHPATVRPDGTIDVAGGKHVNGVVDRDLTSRGCTSCHGGTLTGTDPDGVSLAPAPGTGPHVRHLTGAVARVACKSCHAVPTSLEHSDGTVQLSFAAGLAPQTAWNGSTCATSYCHGAFVNGPNGGAGVTMTWAAVAQPLGCTSCHHGPHRQDHPGGGECNVCHQDVDAAGTRITDPALHVNGRVDKKDCTICH